jgi:hypothetical protein
MKKILTLAAAGLAFAMLPAAAAENIPRPKCDKPRMPGEMMRSDNTVMKRFNQDLDAYTKCMKGYIAERQEVMKANEDAANTAIKEYNDAVKEINEQGKAQ